MDKVDEYTIKLQKDEKLPQIEVYEVPGRGTYIMDGNHRYVASHITGKSVDILYVKGGPIVLPNWLDVLPGKQ